MQKKLIFKYLVIIALVFAMSFGLGTILTQQLMQYGILGLIGNSLTGSASLSGERVNILIIGQDARPNENVTRSDTMIVASIDPELKKVVLLWIPRDTKWVTSKYGTQKINASNSFGGPELCRDAIEDLLGIKLDYYVQLNFDAFRKVVDSLGGVEIDVEDYLYHADPDNPDLEIDLDPGLQTLNGQQSLAYVRYRSYPMGDMDRDSHQAIFVKALAKKALSPVTVLKLPELVMEVQDSLVTDMPIGDMARLASWAPEFSSDAIITQTLPGFYENGYDSSGTLIWCYWKPDEDKTATIIDDLFAGKTFEPYDQAAEDEYNSSHSSSDSGDDGDSNSDSGNTDNSNKQEDSGTDNSNADDSSATGRTPQNENSEPGTSGNHTNTQSDNSLNNSNSTSASTSNNNSSPGR